MKRSKRLNVIIATASVAACGMLLTVASVSSLVQSALLGRADDVSYTILLNSDNASSLLPAEFTEDLFQDTPSRSVKMSYMKAKKATGSHCTLASGGYIANALSDNYVIKGMTSINVVFSGNLSLNYGYENAEDFTLPLSSGVSVAIDGNSFKIVANEEANIVSIRIDYTCKEAVPSGEVTGLSLTRLSDEKVQVNFDEESGKSYEARVDGLTPIDIQNGGTLNLPLKEGEYNVQVRYVNHPSLVVSKWNSLKHTMTHRNNWPDANSNIWTIWDVDGKPYGKGTLVYPGGDTFVGTFEDNWQRKEGRLTFSNGMYYEGKFVNDAFQDAKGTFNWANGGDYGWKYEGAFLNGSPVGQKGTYYSALYFTENALGWWKLDDVISDGFPGFAANQTTGPYSKYVTWFGSSTNYNWYEGPMNIDANKNFNTAGLNGTLSIGRRLSHGEGLQYWTGSMQSNFWPVSNAVGYGEIQFGGSYQDWYEGEILHSGDGDTWIRHGVGTERFSNSQPNTAEANFTWAWQNASEAFKAKMSQEGCKQDKITAIFDKDYSGGWIKGDGYWYILNSLGEPYAYVSGKWEGAVTRTGDIGADSRVTLDPEYVGKLDLTDLWAGR